MRHRGDGSRIVGFAQFGARIWDSSRQHVSEQSHGNVSLPRSRHLQSAFYDLSPSAPRHLIGLLIPDPKERHFPRSLSNTYSLLLLQLFPLHFPFEPYPPSLPLKPSSHPPQGGMVCCGVGIGEQARNVEARVCAQGEEGKHYDGLDWVPR